MLDTRDKSIKDCYIRNEAEEFIFQNLKLNFWWFRQGKLKIGHQIASFIILYDPFFRKLFFSPNINLFSYITCINVRNAEQNDHNSEQNDHNSEQNDHNSEQNDHNSDLNIPNKMFIIRNKIIIINHDLWITLFELYVNILNYNLFKFIVWKL